MKKLKKVVHLSHTDISCDSRILKEINCLSQDPSYELLSVGIAQSKSRVVFEPPAVVNKNLDIVLLELRARNLTYFPKSIRHALTLIELFFKSFFLIKKFGPDIIHCHDTLVLPIGIILKSFRKETILIYDAHELESDKNGITRILSFLT